MSTFRTRQAPSPTGYLHFGTARQMLFTKLFAQSKEGVWYLRVEDTDRNRLKPDAVNKMLSSLEKLGLLPDEGVTNQQVGKKDDFYGVYQTGKYGPYVQSERLGIYHKHAQKLIDKKLAYWSYLSAEEKEELVAIKAATKKPINYYKVNIDRFSEEDLYKSVKEVLSDERKPSLRYHIQRDQVIECYDELLGKTKFDLNLEEDFNILKSDGYPTYHLAHLIDDYLMETTLVNRAQEWFPSLPRHVIMFRDYWGKEPKYLHTPFILGSTGNKKLSKRDSKVDIEDYLEMGYLPEAIVNYLAFLGWNPGTEKELYLESQDFVDLGQPERLKKLINNISKEFSIDKLSKSPARFNTEKLDWFNREYIKMLSLKEFAYLACKNIIEKRPSDEDTTRIGDYVYIVNEKEQLLYCETNAEKPGVENNLHPVGGGREEGVGVYENIKKEIFEETNDQLKIDTDELIKIATYNLKNGDYETEGKVYNLKQFNVYYYATDQKIEPFVEPKKDRPDITFDWVSLGKVIESNEILKYPLWRSFCTKNDVRCFEPTNEIKYQYTAWILDKQRSTLLSEFGSESEGVLNYRRPELSEVKWKKISEQESLQCLSDICEQVIKPFYLSDGAKDILEKQEKMYDLSVSSDSYSEVLAIFNEIVSVWESVIKDWISHSNKDVGSHLWPLRLSLSGKQRSPSPFELLAVLSKEEVATRIEGVLSYKS